MIYPEYESPIQMIMGDMEMRMEGHCVVAAQRAGFNVDEESLRQALENDSQRYREAYRRGYVQRDSEIVRCKDCKKSCLFRDRFHSAYVCTKNMDKTGRIPDEDLKGHDGGYFCADGERKEEDTE